MDCFSLLGQNDVEFWEWENLSWPAFQWPKDLICQDARHSLSSGSYLQVLDDNQGKHQEPTLFGECLGFLWPTTQTEISQHGTGVFPQIVIGLMGSIITPSIITWDSGSKFIVLCQRNLILWTSLEVSKVKTDFNNNYYRKVRNQRKVGN